MMKKIFYIVIVFLLPTYLLQSQTIKGLYVDGFSTILGNAQKEDSLLLFAQNNGFNYLTLYQMHIVNAATPLSNAAACTTFTNFISKAKTQYGILQIGVAAENYNFFANNIYPYNQQHTIPTEKIDVYNLEFEFWVPNSINPGGVYCVDYLTNAGYTCDSAGAFTYYKKMLNRIDSLANADGKISETYFGWFSATEGVQIVQSGVDRISLSVYLPSANYSASYQYNYINTRLQHVASANTIIKVLPLYSAEPSFMQTWATTNPFFQPYTDLQTSLQSEPSSWKNYIQLEGIQWFAYTDMPIKNTNVSIVKTMQNTIDIYPNPSNGKFIISNMQQGCNIKIVDCLGRIVTEFNKVYNTQQIDISHQPAGMYTLLVTNKHTVSSIKIMIN